MFPILGSASIKAHLDLAKGPPNCVKTVCSKKRKLSVSLFFFGFVSHIYIEGNTTKLTIDDFRPSSTLDSQAGYDVHITMKWLLNQFYDSICQVLFNRASKCNILEKQTIYFYKLGSASHNNERITITNRHRGDLAPSYVIYGNENTTAAGKYVRVLFTARLFIYKIIDILISGAHSTQWPSKNYSTFTSACRHGLHWPVIYAG